MSTITAQIQLRRDTSANWTSNNPILLAGEMALSTDVLYSGTDQPRYKIGNGVDAWLNLDYVPEGGAGYPENLFLTVVNKTTDNLLASGYKVLKVVLGYVVYSHVNQGKIYIKIDNGYEIGELHNCYLPSPNNNDGIFWSSGTTRYENKSITTALGYTPENSSNKGIANGYAPLGNDSKVDVAYLPSYVSDILEYANLAAFPVTGQSGKIYLALDTNKVYRWSGSTYIEVAANSGVWGAITGTITNQTDLQNALNSKYNIYYLGSSGLNLADSTTYYIGIVYYLLGTVEALKRFNFENSETVKEIYLNSLHTGAASSENLTIYLRNITTGVDNLIGTLKEDYPINSSKTFAFTGLNISVNNSDLYTIKLVTPSFAVNPTAVNYSIKIKTI
jgi:hypothetical protein